MEKPANEHMAIVAKLEVPCRKTSLTYDKTVYREDILNEIIDQDEFDKIIDECSKILGEAIDKKRENDEVKVPKFIVILSVVATILALVYVICLFCAASNDSDAATFFVVLGVACLTGAGGIAFVLSLFNFCRKIKKFKTLESYVKDDMDYYLDRVNAGFASKCEFKFYPHKDEVIEISTFVKTPQMIKDEMIENNRIQQLEQSDEPDIQNEKNYKNKDESERSTMLKMDDDSKIAFKTGDKSTMGKDVEMVGIISAAQNSMKEDGSQTKKIFGSGRKKNQ